jgi:hypothetical protein
MIRPPLRLEIITILVLVLIDNRYAFGKAHARPKKSSMKGANIDG